MVQKFKVIAHRGNSSEAPENTRSSFIQAIDMSVDFIECDIQFTLDKVPVLFHDACFTRISKKKSTHRINLLNLEDVNTYDAGSWFHPDYSHEKIMTFDELLTLPRGNTGMMIEVKEDTFTSCRTETIVQKMLHQYACAIDPLAPILIGSLSSKVLSHFDGHLPSNQLIPIIHEEAQLNEFLPLKATVYAISKTHASKRFIHKIKDLGAEVWVWTVDDTHQAKHLIHSGADGIITNHPKKMIALRNQLV